MCYNNDGDYMEVNFINDYDESYDEFEDIYNSLMKRTFNKLGVKDNYVIEINLIDDVAIHEINREYRKIDRPTDVISFAFNDNVDGEVKIISDIPRLLGEIFISVDRALLQAKNYHHSLKREMSFLFVHGLLHLLGYDHDTKEKEKEMFELQDTILKEEEIIC